MSVLRASNSYINMRSEFLWTSFWQIVGGVCAVSFPWLVLWKFPDAQEEYGRFSGLLRMAQWCALFVVAGWPVLVTRNVAQIGDSFSFFWRFRYEIARWVIVGGSFVTLLLYGYYGNKWIVLAIFLFIVLWMIYEVSSSSLIGLDRSPLAQFSRTLSYVSVIVLLLISDKFHVIGSLILYAFMPSAVAMISLVSLSLYLFREESKSVISSSENRIIRSVIKAGIPAFLAGGIETVPMMLLHPFGDREMALFDAAVRLGMAQIFLLSSLNAVVAGRFVRAYVQNDKELMEKICRTIANLGLALSGCIFIVVYIGIRIFLPNFYPEAWCKDILLFYCPVGVAQIINAAMGPVAMALLLSAHEKHVVKGMGVGFLVVLCGGIGQAWLWGALGIPLAYGEGIVAWNLMLAYSARKVLGIKTWAGKSEL